MTKTRDLGATIAAARVRRRWSQDVLAHEAGISLATVKRAEASREAWRVSRATVALIAWTLGLDFGDLDAREEQRCA